MVKPHFRQTHYRSRAALLPLSLCLWAVALSLSLQVFARDTSMDATMNPTGSPFGGGEGYLFTIETVDHHDFRVTSKDQLLQALKDAKAGQVIFLPGDVVIDLTGHRKIRIPEGVILASDRGHKGSKGALLFTTDDWPTRQLRMFHLFETAGPGIRVTGLRLRGPDPKRRDRDAFVNSIGIMAKHNRLEVDNCEISGWSYAGVRLQSGSNHRVHHNHIHHNQRAGLGYGVHVLQSEALVEANIFESNRHAIAGSTRKAYRASYEARYNLVLERANGHSFDMHGYYDPVTKVRYAGNWIDIHHNIFQTKAKPVVIRGKPAILAQVHHNWFVYRTTPKDAVLQRKGKGNLRIYSNWYGKGKKFIP